jgi:mono/diheme cytochrome c family protein
MPSFGATLTFDDVQLLAEYVEDQGSVAEGPELFAQNCAICHGTQVLSTGSVEQTVAVISTGGSHTTMPVWGEVLTDAQIDALVAFITDRSQGVASGQQIFAESCAGCHGSLGEGGANPTRPGDIIAPISSAEYLRTRDDATLYAIISQGQPDFGMSPFGLAFGGPLSDDQLRAVVSFIRAWEADPPTELPAAVAEVPAASASGDEVFASLCAQCHGSDGSGGIGPALDDPQWQAAMSDDQIFSEINEGHPATSMIAWGEILNAGQITELVSHIRSLTVTAATAIDVPAAPTYTQDIAAIFAADCGACHGTSGGWSGETYRDALLSGDSGPMIFPGSAGDSLLYQSLIGTHPRGVVMPPGGSLAATDIELIRRWIDTGAPE